MCRLQEPDKEGDRRAQPAGNISGRVATAGACARARACELRFLNPLKLRVSFWSKGRENETVKHSMPNSDTTHTKQSKNVNALIIPVALCDNLSFSLAGRLRMWKVVKGLGI